MKNNLKMQRALKGVTQKELATEIGVSRQSIVAIEQGKYVPSTVLALKFARFFEIEVEDIFELEKED